MVPFLYGFLDALDALEVSVGVAEIALLELETKTSCVGHSVPRPFASDSTHAIATSSQRVNNVHDGSPGRPDTSNGTGRGGSSTSALQ